MSGNTDIEYSASNPPPWKREKDLLEKYIAADDLDKHDARNFVPDVTMQRYVAGDFLCYWKLELPRRFIESIEPGVFADFLGHGGNGHAPYKSYQHPSHAVKAACAGIKITMHSGQTHTITCNRWQTDILLHTLRNVWKNCLSREEEA